MGSSSSEFPRVLRNSARASLRSRVFDSTVVEVLSLMSVESEDEGEVARASMASCISLRTRRMDKSSESFAERTKAVSRKYCVTRRGHQQGESVLRAREVRLTSSSDLASVEGLKPPISFNLKKTTLRSLASRICSILMSAFDSLDCSSALRIYPPEASNSVLMPPTRTKICS